MLIDLDASSSVNDYHGTRGRDAARVVQALVGEFRAFDRVARYGGDEFVVILPNAELESAAALATRRSSDSWPGEPARWKRRVATIGVAQWQAP